MTQFWMTVIVAGVVFNLTFAVILVVTWVDRWHARRAERKAFIETIEDQIAAGNANLIPKEHWNLYIRLTGGC